MELMELFSGPGWQRLGVALPHFLWPGLAVMVLLTAAVVALRLRHGPPRYAAYLAAMTAIGVGLGIASAGGQSPPATQSGTHADIPQLVQKLRSGDEAVWKPAAERLIKIGPAVAEPVAELYSKGGPGDAHAVKVLQALAADPRVQKVMVKGLTSRNSNVVHCSLIVLGSSGNRKHVEAIVPHLKSRALAASIALGQLGGDEAFDALVRGLRQVPAEEVWFVAGELAKFKRPEAVPHLKEVLKRTDARTLKFARRIVGAIRKTQGKDATPGSYGFSIHAVGDRKWRLLEAYDLGRMTNVHVQPFRPDATEERTRARAYQALQAKGGCLLAWEISGGHRLLAFQGLKLAPLTLSVPPKYGLWDDVWRFFHQRELAKRVEDYNRGQAAELAGPLKGMRVYPFVQGEDFIALAPGGRRAFVRIQLILDQLDKDIRRSILHMSAMPLDPLYALIPPEAYPPPATQPATAPASPPRGQPAGEARELEPLIQQLRSKEAADQAQAALKLGQMGEKAAPAVEALIANLDDLWSYVLLDPDDSTNTTPGLEALKALAKIGKPAVEPLCRALTDSKSSDETRARAATALAKIKDPRAAAALTAALKDKTDHVAQEAAGALAALGRVGLKPLLAALKSDSPRLRSTAAYHLGDVGEAAVIKPLVGALKDRAACVRAASASAMRRLAWRNIRDAQAVAALIAALNDQEVEVRRNAAIALGAIHDKRAVEPLMAALKDPDATCRAYAAEALGWIGDRHALDPLVLALADEHASVRALAAGALGCLKDLRAVSPLTAALDDEERRVREAASRALGDLQGREQHELRWGKVVHGLQAGVGFQHGQRPFRYGETAHFTVQVRNVTDRPITFTVMAGDPWPLFDAATKTIRLGGAVGRLQLMKHIVSAGGTTLMGHPRFEIWPTSWKGLPRGPVLQIAPGTYKLTHSVWVESPGQSKKGDPGHWTAALPAGELALEILAPTPERMRALSEPYRLSRMAVAKVAGRFLEAVRLNDADALDSLTAKIALKLTREDWQELAAELRKAYAGRLGQMEVRETVVIPGYAAGRVDDAETPSGPYLRLILERGPDRWLVRDAAEADPKLPLKQQLYHFLGKPAKKAPTTGPAADKATFGPAVERVIYVPEAGRDSFLDLETGRLMTQGLDDTPDDPTMSRELNEQRRRSRWARRSGADLMCLPYADPRAFGLGGLDMAVARPPEGGWQLTPRQAAEALGGRDFYAINEMRSGARRPATFLVETRDGRVGVIQILAVTAKPPGIRIRYKLAPVSVKTAPWPPLWINLAPSEETVRSLKDLAVLAHTGNLNQAAARTGEWEIRTADNRKRIARIEYPWGVDPEQFLPDGKRITGGRHRLARCTLGRSQLRLIGAVADGDYLLAWYAAGKRCSNVIRFRIAKDHDTRTEPLLGLAQVEPGPGEALPLLVLRARRHKVEDPAPLASAVAYPTLNVNGQDRTTASMAWSGPNVPLRVGGHYAYMLDLSRYTRDPKLGRKAAPLEPGKPYVIFAKVGDLKSNTITLSFDRSGGQAWDRATPGVAPAPEPKVPLIGMVTGPDGQPGRGYEVMLSSKARRIKERCRQDGHYEFLNISPDTYKLICNPPGRGQPVVVIEGIAVAADSAIVRNVSLESKFILTGRIRYESGKPAAGMSVDLSCRSENRDARFGNTTNADAGGRYEIGAPFGRVTYVGINGGRIDGPMPQLKPGLNRVDYVLRKKRRGHVAAPAPPAGAKNGPAQPRPIALGKEKLRIGSYPKDDSKAGLYAIGPYTRTRVPPFPHLYGRAVQGKVARGCQELVGRLAGLYPAGDEFVVEEFRRVGGRITARVKHILSGQADARRDRAVCVWAPLPELPSGHYTVEIHFREYERKGGRIVHVLKGGRIPVQSLRCEFDVPAAGQGRALRQLAERAIALRPRDRPAGKTAQNPTGLDFSAILRLTGQQADLEAFTKDHRHFQRDVKALAQAQKVWVLSALLDHPNVDAKIYAARALAELARPDTAAALLAAAKSNNYGVQGSEVATMQFIYRRTLKRGLEKITGLALTPAGLQVIEYAKPGQPRLIRSEEHPEHFRERVDFKRVEGWLRSVFLPGKSAPASQPATARLGSPQAAGPGSPQAARPGSSEGQPAGEAAFGPAGERVLKVNSLRDSFLDLDSGKILSYPKGQARDEKTDLTWRRRNGIDVNFSAYRGAKGKYVLLLCGLDLVAGPVAGKLWDATPAELGVEAKKAEWNPRCGQRVGPVPTTFVFRTREGGVGVLRVVQVTGGRWGPRQVKIRYKLLARPPPEPDEEQVAWGEPVGGIQCSVWPARKAFAPGEDLLLDVMYRNVSRRPVTVCVYPDPFYVWTVLEVRDAAGVSVARGAHAQGVQRALQATHFVTLAPGAAACVRQVIARDRLGRTPLKPGRHVVRVAIGKINRMEQHVPGFDDVCVQHDLRPWMGVIESGVGGFQIVPTPKVHWGQTVDGLQVGVGEPQPADRSADVLVFLRNLRTDDKKYFDGAMFELELDGRRYVHRDWAAMNARQECVYRGQVRAVRLWLADYIAQKDKDKARTAARPLAELSAGAHRIRLTCVGRNGAPRISAPELTFTFAAAEAGAASTRPAPPPTTGPGSRQAQPAGEPAVSVWDCGIHLMGLKPSPRFAAWADGTVLRYVKGRFKIGKVAADEVEALLDECEKAGFFKPPVKYGLVKVDARATRISVWRRGRRQVLDYDGSALPKEYGPDSSPTRAEVEALIKMWRRVETAISKVQPESLQDYEGGLRLALPKPLYESDAPPAGPEEGMVPHGLECVLLPERQTVRIAEGRAFEGVHLTYLLRNATDRPIKFLPWDTPLEGKVNGDIFRVVGPDGWKVGYSGPSVERRQAEPKDFLTIAAGQTLLRRVPLPYDFIKAGTHRVSMVTVHGPAPAGPRINEYYGGDAAKAKRNSDRVWTGQLRSNEVSVEVVRVGRLPWGPVVNGLQASLSCLAVEHRPEPRVVLALRLRNAGQKPLRILRLRARKRSWGSNLPIEVKLAGKVLPYKGPVLTPPPPPGKNEYIDLPPGRMDAVKAVMLPKYWRLKDPSGAEVTFVFANTLGKGIASPYDRTTGSWTTVEGLWTGQVRSNSVKMGKPAAAAGAAWKTRRGAAPAAAPLSQPAGGGAASAPAGPAGPPPPRPAKADFEQLTAEIASGHRQVGSRAIVIRGDGSADFTVRSLPEAKVTYTASFRLERKHLRELADLLKQTDWLAKPGWVGPVPPGAADISLTLSRGGKERHVRCSHRRPEAYRPLAALLWRIHRQEDLLRSLTAPPAGAPAPAALVRQRAASAIKEEIEAIQSTSPSVSKPAVPILDYRRFLPALAPAIADPAQRHTDEILAALRLCGHLRDGSRWDAISALRGHESLAVQAAALETLLRIGGPRVGEILKGITADAVNPAVADALVQMGAEAMPVLRKLLPGSRAVIWPVVRMGRPAVPVIVDFLRAKPCRNQVHLIRAYLDHWEQLPDAVDAQVVAAVRENLDERLILSGHSVGYHHPFLWLASKAHRKAGRLEFRLLATAGGRQYVEKLQADGPELDVRVWTRWQWFEVQCDLPGSVVAGEHRGRRYALVYLSPGLAMFSDAAGPGAWGLKKVWAEKDDRGRPAVGFQLDENGSKRFAELAGRNKDRLLAVVVDEKIVSTIAIGPKAPLPGVMVGRLTGQEAQALVKALSGGMPPTEPFRRPPKYAFTPTTERILTAARREQPFYFIDFETGKASPAPFKLQPQDKGRKLEMSNLALTDRLKDWIKVEGIDLAVEVRPDKLCLMGLGMLTQAPGIDRRLTLRKWQGLDADEVARPYRRYQDPRYPTGRGVTFRSSLGARTAEYGFPFMTCDRNVGVMLITDYSGEARRAKLRFRMVCPAAGDLTRPVPVQPPPKPDALDEIALEGKWNALGDADVTKAHAAARALVGAGEKAGAFLAARLKLLAGPGKAQEWITGLEDRKYAVRAGSYDGLRGIGRLAEPVLRKALKQTESAEARVRIQEILEGFPKAYATSAEVRRLIRAFWVLELIDAEKAGAFRRGLAGAAAEAVPIRALTSDQLGAARAAQSRAERLRAAYERKYRERKWADKTQEAMDFAEAVLAYREVMEAYLDTEEAIYCQLRLLGLYGRRDRRRTIELMEDLAGRYRGTKHEIKAYFCLGLEYLQGLHKPAEAIPYFEKVPYVPGRYDEGQSRHFSAQQSAAKCEIQLGRLDDAHRRCVALARRFPQYKEAVARAYEFELGSAELAGEEIKKWMARFAQDLKAPPK